MLQQRVIHENTAENTVFDIALQGWRSWDRL